MSFDFGTTLSELESLAGDLASPTGKQIATIVGMLIQALPAIESGAAKAEPFIAAAIRVAMTGGMGLSQQDWQQQLSQLNAILADVDQQVASDEASSSTSDPAPAAGSASGPAD